MDFYQMTGKMALGSRLRRLSEMITEDAAKLYALYQVELEPRWFPVFYLLAETPHLTVTEIAQSIGHSHASVSQIVKEMKKNQLIRETKDKSDGRKALIALTEKGKGILPKIASQYIDVREAVEELFSQMQYDLWKAMEETEYLLGQKNLLERVRVKKKERESQQASIVDYTPQFQSDFKRLNVEWIETYFQLEEKDLQTLNNPQTYILNQGGHILVALYQGEVVGTCALLKIDETTYELAKMAVSPQAQGKGIGWLLGKASIQKAKSLGASKVFLESNTILQSAINLYRKLGFQKVTGIPSPYQRSNIQMELSL
jgi:N-acetylglutamate synthase-like GNAT family acetyltransferase/DNA-binding PadR family transcriptional regulator